MTFLISCYHHDNHDYHHVHDNNCHVQGAGSSVEQLDLPLGVQQGGGEGGYRAGDHHDHDEDEDEDVVVLVGGWQLKPVDVIN